MKQSFYTFLAAIGIGCTLVSFQSCKEDTILNANIVPVGDTINTIKLPDTITILTKTYFDDSTLTHVNYIFPALGTITAAADPWTGKTSAGLYIQLVPPTFGFAFPKDPDSAVFILPYAGFTWGDTSNASIQTFTAYEIDDTLSKDAAYYSSTVKNVDRSKVLGKDTINFTSLKDSVFATGANRAPHLRMKLSQDFIDKIKSGGATGSAADFLQLFKGIYIEPDTNSGNALYYFRMDGPDDYSRANVLFYYTDKTAFNQDTVKTASFYYNPTYTAYYNRVTRNYTGTPIAPLLASTAATDTIFVIQNEPGAALDIKIPYIKHLPKSPINKAELVITQVSFSDPNGVKYTPPARIYPTGINANGGSYTILDRFPINSNEPLQFIGGERKVVTVGGMEISQYRLNIPREIQRAIVEQRDMLHLRISGTVLYPGAFRFIGAGGSQVKLNIVYSKI